MKSIHYTDWGWFIDHGGLAGPKGPFWTRHLAMRALYTHQIDCFRIGSFEFVGTNWRWNTPAGNRQSVRRCEMQFIMLAEEAQGLYDYLEEYYSMAVCKLPLKIQIGEYTGVIYDMLGFTVEVHENTSLLFITLEYV